ncbi:MAG: 4Fe-4S binding protein, partial [Eubacteriales bacterium]
MSKKIIKIDDEKCVGCGLCANTCKQSAIEIVNGKAKVIHEDYCDGIGNCLPVCPVNAISFSDKNIVAKESKPLPCSCPSSHSKELNPVKQTSENVINQAVSALRQWPVQIKLVPEQAPYFENSHLLIAADCTAYAYANFHNEFMNNKITLIGCPKLDDGDYTHKLTQIIANNTIKSVTVVRMEVPCCGGIENATVNALKASGKFI